MFWLFENNQTDNNQTDNNQTKPKSTSYNFFQIFNLASTQIESDTIYKLNSDVFPLILGTNYHDIIVKNNIKPEIINYCIKIIGKNISWTNLDTLSTTNFIQKYKFINQNDNKLGLPIFEFNYIIDKNKIPELTSSSYDFYYPEVQFEIFKINNNLILVKELNKTNHSKRNYILTKKI